MNMNRGQNRYLLDANVFIQAHKSYYAFDIAPRFWDSLLLSAETGLICSIDRVKDEIDRQKDQLTAWANDGFSTYFIGTDEPSVLQSYAQIMQWASAQSQYTQAALAEFAEERNADAWLVAYANVTGMMIVTHEQLNRDVQRRVPLPNVCNAFGIQCLNTFQMLRILGIQLN